MRRLWTCQLLATVLMAVSSLSAKATVTITSADRFVSVFPSGGVETKSQSLAITGNFVDALEVFAPPGEGDNDGSLYADQDTTISGLTVFGFGKIFIQGSNPDPPGFGGTAESSVTINFLLSETTAYTLSGLLSELEDGGSAFARATLLDSLLSPISTFRLPSMTRRCC